MERKQAKPAWWLVYATLPVLIGLLLLSGRVGLPQWLELPSAFLIVVSSFGSIGIWVHLTAARLSEEELSSVAGDESYRVTVYEPAQSSGEPRQGKVVYLDVSSSDWSSRVQNKRRISPRYRPLRRTSGFTKALELSGVPPASKEPKNDAALIESMGAN